MVKAFLFDYDGVITKGVEDGMLAQRLAANINIPPEQASEWLQEIWQPLLRAEITDDEVWARFEAKYGQPIAGSQRDIWFRWDELTPLPEMIELVKTLKVRGYPVGLVSNVTVDTARTIRRHGGYDEFDFLILGCEIGSKKPELEIFQAALDKLPNIKPNEIAFLEDRESNTDAASQLGMKTILVKNHGDAIQEVFELIAEVAA